MSAWYTPLIVVSVALAIRFMRASGRSIDAHTRESSIASLVKFRGAPAKDGRSGFSRR